MAEHDVPRVVGIGGDVGAGEATGAVTEAHSVGLPGIGEDCVAIAVAVHIAQGHLLTVVGVGGDAGAAETASLVAKADLVCLARVGKDGIEVVGRQTTIRLAGKST